MKQKTYFPQESPYIEKSKLKEYQQEQEQKEIQKQAQKQKYSKKQQYPRSQQQSIENQGQQQQPQQQETEKQIQKQHSEAEKVSDEDLFKKQIEQWNQILQNLNNADLCRQMKIYYYQHKNNIQLPKVINQIFTQKENAAILIEKLFEILNLFISEKMTGIFLKYLLGLIKKNSEMFDFKYEELKQRNIKQYVNIINCENIALFIEVFHLEDQVNKEDFLNHFYDLIKKKNFDDALKYHTVLKLDQSDLINLIKSMDTKESCTKAGQFIKKLKLNPADFPTIKKKQCRKTAGYMLYNFPIDQCEEQLQHDQCILLELCYMLNDKGKQQEAASIIKRQGLLELIDEQPKREFFQEILNSEYFIENNNKLFTRDYFGPSDVIFNENQEYLKSVEVGYDQDHVVFVDSISIQHQNAWIDIFNSYCIGLDTEFYNSKVNLDSCETKLLILQIATPTFAYVFDVPKLENENEFKNSVQKFLTNDTIIKAGHTVQNDIKLLCKYLGLKDFEIHNIVDISHHYKRFNKNNPTTNGLASITEYIFKKPLSKLEQISDWQQRPLRQGQLHYAAMDAILGIKIYEIMKKDLINMDTVDINLKAQQDKQNDNQDEENLDNENPIKAQIQEKII